MDQECGDAVGRPVAEGLGPPQGMQPGEFLEAAVSPADEVRERLLSFMVHEIRNPLASAMWGVEMLERRSMGDARGDRMAKLSARSVRRVRSLLEDFFALERLPKKVPPGRVDLHAAVVRALGPHDLEPKGIEAQVVGAEELETPLNPGLVDKLLHACVRRAAHAGEGGAISVAVGVQGAQGEVVVSRYGVPAEVVDPPVLSPGGSEGGGTTFSMLLARTVAQRLGVALDVQSTHEGTTIRLLFPLLGEQH